LRYWKLSSWLWKPAKLKNKHKTAPIEQNCIWAPMVWRESKVSAQKSRGGNLSVHVVEHDFVTTQLRFKHKSVKGNTGQGVFNLNYCQWRTNKVQDHFYGPPHTHRRLTGTLNVYQTCKLSPVLCWSSSITSKARPDVITNTRPPPQWPSIKRRHSRCWSPQPPATQQNISTHTKTQSYTHAYW